MRRYLRSDQSIQGGKVYAARPRNDTPGVDEHPKRIPFAVRSGIDPEEATNSDDTLVSQALPKF